jgi:hypothetical protein
MKQLITISLIAAYLFVTPAAAELVKPERYVGLAVLVLNTDEARKPDANTDGGFGIKGYVDLPIGKRSSLGLGGIAKFFDTDGPESKSQFGFEMDWRIEATPSKRISPYLVLGTGLAFTEQPGSNLRTNLMGSAGVGSSFYNADHSSLWRVEVKAVVDNDKHSVPGVNQFHDIQLSIAHQWQFGDKLKKF